MKSSFVAMNVMLLFNLNFFVVTCRLSEKSSKSYNVCTDIGLNSTKVENGDNVLFLKQECSDWFVKFMMKSGLSITFQKNVNGLIYFHYPAYLIMNHLNFIALEQNSLHLTCTVGTTKCLIDEQILFDILNENYSTNGESCQCSLCSHDSLEFFSSNLTYCSCLLLTCFNYSAPHRNTMSNSLEQRTKRWPDMMGKKIEVVTFHRPISTIIHHDESDLSKRYDGLEMNIFIEIAKKLNMTWQINELNGEVDKWGQLQRNGSWRGGIMEQLTSGTAEVGFSTLWMSSLQMPYLDYMTPWTTISSTFLVPRPTVIGISWESLVRPFTPPLWCLVVMSLLLFPITVWALIHLHLMLTREQLPAETSSVVESKNLESNILYTLGSITGGSGMLSKREELPVRILVSWWYIFILLLCTSYNSKIMASLTLPSYTPKINTVQQLVEQQFSWGRPYSEDNLSKHLDFEKYWHRRLAKNFVVYNESNVKTMLMSKKFALTVQQIESCDHLFMDNPIEDEIIENFRVMEEKIVRYRCAIAFRKHSTLVPVFNAVLERLIETGLVKHIKEDAVRRFQRPAYKRILLELDYGIQSNKIVALTMENYNFMIYLYFFGLLISVGCFLIELCG